jgi:hypothetical protein
MALGDLSGASRTNPRNPFGQGVCDRTGFALQHNRMQRQFQWGGAKLFDTGYLVRPQSLDKPQDQYRSLILPGDPQPLVNPRPDYWQTPPYPANTPGNQGFQQYELSNQRSLTGAAYGIGYFQIGISPIGVEGVLDVAPPWDQQAVYPTTKAGALGSLEVTSGIPVPSTIVDRSISLGQNMTQTLMAANPARAWLAIYSPSQAPSAFNLATAVWGLTTNLMIGPGQCWFWATSAGLGTVWQGAITAISLTPGNPLWAWEA